MRAHPSDLVHAGELVDLDITGVAHPGRFVGRTDGLAVFVAGTDIGERVRVRITAVKRRYAEAELIEVLDASPNRVRQIWPEAEVTRDPGVRVGGADYGHLTLQRQRELKAIVLRESFERVGDLGEHAPVVPVQAIPGRPDGLHWRTRELLQVDAEGRIGAFAAHSHTVVPVSGLPLVAEDLVEALGALEAETPAAGPLDVSRLRLTPSTQVRLARDEGRPNRVVVGDPRSTPAGRPVTRTAAGHRFEVAVDGFWQVHERAPEVLSAAVRAAVPAGRFRSALDLYGGVGLFAAVLTESIQRVETVEADRTASGLARRNLRDTEVRVSQGRVDRVLAQYSEQRARWATGGAAVLDPPRSGAGRGVLRQLAELRLGRIVYVACDPVALARDTRTLLGLGYEMGEVRALDLFPHSHHFEVVAIFDR